MSEEIKKELLKIIKNLEEENGMLRLKLGRVRRALGDEINELEQQEDRFNTISKENEELKNQIEYLKKLV
jgi:regulator of replication initiation timing